MILLSDSNRRTVLLIGLGLVGSSVLQKALISGWSEVSRRKVNWSDADHPSLQLNSLISSLQFKPILLDVVWMAGKAGFQSSEEQTSLEQILFKKLIQTVRVIEFPFRFLFLSSAGELFEGQRLVDSQSVPCPMRPYGHLKLDQEKLLATELGSRFSVLILRPSTIFGYTMQGQRGGLVYALAKNGLNHRVTQVTGDPDTLRDYVWVEDVSKYIVDRLNGPSDQPGVKTEYLVSGQPVSIHQMKVEVERRLGRHLYVNYLQSGPNRAPMTYHEHLRPPNWRPSPLGEGIFQIIHRIRSD